MKNTPYVKEYDKFGNVKNPIPTGYFHNFLNRKQRRESLQKIKLFGRRVQIIWDAKTEKRKRIYHLE
jgi:hypothetical protein